MLNNGRRVRQDYSAAELIAGCHANSTIFNILKLEKVMDSLNNSLVDWVV